jgi:hypothetical protein
VLPREVQGNGLNSGACRGEGVTTTTYHSESRHGSRHGRGTTIVGRQRATAVGPMAQGSAAVRRMGERRVAPATAHPASRTGTTARRKDHRTPACFGVRAYGGGVGVAHRDGVARGHVLAWPTQFNLALFDRPKHLISL